MQKLPFEVSAKSACRMAVRVRVPPRAPILSITREMLLKNTGEIVGAKREKTTEHNR